jgi:hypothetical protein
LPALLLAFATAINHLAASGHLFERCCQGEDHAWLKQCVRRVSPLLLFLFTFALAM